MKKKLTFYVAFPNDHWNDQTTLGKEQSRRSIYPYQRHIGRTDTQFVCIFYQ
jgi:hypothetical protein